MTGFFPGLFFVLKYDTEMIRNRYESDPLMNC